MESDSPPLTPWEIERVFIDDRTQKLLALSEAQWWEYRRKEKAMYRILPEAVKVLESLEEVNQTIEINKKQRQHFSRSDSARFCIGILFSALSPRFSTQYIGLLIALTIWLVWFQIQPALECGDLKREAGRLRLRYADLEREFVEHFGRSHQFKELTKAWDSAEAEITEKLEDAALSEIKRCSQSAYREHLEKLVEMHTV